MLHINKQEQSSQYWPEFTEAPYTTGGITVELKSETKQKGYTERGIAVSEKVLHVG